MFLQKCGMFRTIAPLSRRSSRGGCRPMNRRTASADYGIWRFARAVDRSRGAGNTDEDLAVAQGRFGVELGGVVATGAGSAGARGKACRAGDRQQRLQERSQAAEG